MRKRGRMILLLAAFRAAAQTPPAAQPLTLGQAEAIALRNHPKIAAAQNVEYRRRAAGSGSALALLSFTQRRDYRLAGEQSSRALARAP